MYLVPNLSSRRDNPRTFHMNVKDEELESNPHSHNDLPCGITSQSPCNAANGMRVPTLSVSSVAIKSPTPTQQQKRPRSPFIKILNKSPANQSECQHKGIWHRIFSSHHLTHLDSSPYTQTSETCVLVSRIRNQPTESSNSTSIVEPPIQLASPSPVQPSKTSPGGNSLNKQKLEEIRRSLLQSPPPSHKPLVKPASSQLLSQSTATFFPELTPAEHLINQRQFRPLPPHTHHLSPHHLTPIKESTNAQQHHHHGIANLFKELWHRSEASASSPKLNGIRRSQSEDNIANKYGVAQEIVGKGAGGIVKLAHKGEGETEKLFALKEFRRRHKNESEKDYIKRLLNEFCISSALNHPHIVSTIDLLQDEQKHWVEVMEYCQGGDLYSVIHDHGPLGQAEADCLFKQLIHGVAYLHKNGVAHRDLKPENLVLDGCGCLKITDFGSAEVVQTVFEKQAHASRGVCGSTPYIAPEEWKQAEFDARKVDIWACGIIYFVMIYSRIPWKIAACQDPNYRYFLSHRCGLFSPIDNLKPELSQLLNVVLEPNPNHRIFVDGILLNGCFQSLQTCHKFDMNPPSASTAEFTAHVQKVKQSKKTICDKVGFDIPAKELK